MTTHPPAPWDLAGRGHVTVWRVPTEAVPSLPFGVTPVTVRGRATVVTAFVDYDETGLMAYAELLAGVLVHRRRGLRPGLGLSITDIWVDSETSRAGGRALWGIPKEMAVFDGLSAQDASGTIAAASFTPRRGPALPLPFPLPGAVVQTVAGRTVASPIRASGRIRPARATWSVDADGPLAWLRAGRPGPSVVAERFAMRFGA